MPEMKLPPCNVKLANALFGIVVGATDPLMVILLSVGAGGAPAITLKLSSCELMEAEPLPAVICHDQTPSGAVDSKLYIGENIATGLTPIGLALT